ncbi:MAG: LPXTG cell wall anchor domain-containing protein [Actinobacteria bacterium]|jgi:LPXTG-motif cell wall-anchored protein|nr:LPXTG cell wall anchor domain-containing protein [Actinomycetota bacterium]MBU1493658.1 LPXTG cell wall anchor domain-containing protein [Actinomycetota bacterium]
MTVEKTDLEAKLREIQEVIDETTGSVKSKGMAIAIGVVLILLIAFLMGRRKGKQGSARVEVYRLG